MARAWAASSATRTVSLAVPCTVSVSKLAAHITPFLGVQCLRKWVGTLINPQRTTLHGIPRKAVGTGMK